MLGRWTDDSPEGGLEESMMKMGKLNGMIKALERRGSRSVI